MAYGSDGEDLSRFKIEPGDTVKMRVLEQRNIAGNRDNRDNRFVYVGDTVSRTLFMGRRPKPDTPTPEAIMDLCERLLEKHIIMMEKYK